MSASAAAATIETSTITVQQPSGDRRWHPAVRAAVMVALGALAWIPVVMAGRMILG